MSDFPHPYSSIGIKAQHSAFLPFGSHRQRLDHCRSRVFFWTLGPGFVLWNSKLKEEENIFLLLLCTRTKEGGQVEKASVSSLLAYANRGISEVKKVVVLSSFAKRIQGSIF